MEPREEDKEETKSIRSESVYSIATHVSAVTVATEQLGITVIILFFLTILE